MNEPVNPQGIRPGLPSRAEGISRPAGEQAQSAIAGVSGGVRVAAIRNCPGCKIRLHQGEDGNPTCSTCGTVYCARCGASGSCDCHE